MIFAILGSNHAFACGCPNISLEESVKGADSIFLGEVVGGKKHPQGQYYTEVYFKVEKSWKKINGHKAHLKVGRPYACNFQFVQGRRYLVFASYTSPNFTSVCSRTKLADISLDDIKSLGATIPLK